MESKLVDIFKQTGDFLGERHVELLRKIDQLERHGTYSNTVRRYNGSTGIVSKTNQAVIKSHTPQKITLSQG